MSDPFGSGQEWNARNKSKVINVEEERAQNYFTINANCTMMTMRSIHCTIYKILCQLYEPRYAEDSTIFKVTLGSRVQK